jgi:uncharacterized delta-60 repeat protein
VQPDGKILVGGAFSSFNGQPRHSLVRLNPDGSLDNTFSDGLVGWVSGVSRLALENNGKILIASYNALPTEGLYPTNIARLNADGSFDPTFLNGLTGPDRVPNVLLSLPSGKVLMAGTFSSVNGIPCPGVARLMGEFTPPVLVKDPNTQTAESGTDIDLRVRINGYDLLYQWFFNGVPIAGATNATLHLSSVSSAQVGDYTVVVSNQLGTVTSAPASLNVIAPVQRKPVPGLILSSQTGTLLSVEWTELIGPLASWQMLERVMMSNSGEFYFDLEPVLSSQRFYRVSHTNSMNPPPDLNLRMVPAITLTGTVGTAIRVDCINALGPTGAWTTLATVYLTNTSRLYFDVSAPPQPARLYRLVQLP